MPKVPLHFTHNGEEKAEFIDSGTTVLKLLRDKVGDLTPKAGCLQGTCGSCTVLIDGAPRLSCITLAEDCDGAAIATVAGLAADGRPHTLQQAFLDHFAAQCGFCTPGMLMAAAALLARAPNPSRDDVLDALSGNICRCTGYEPIVQAVLAAAGSAASGAAPQQGAA